MTQPLVSVRVTAYNHDKYIRQCIEGILMQKTNFPFEIVIGEDCSTDKTRSIVFNYEEKFPEIIHVITSEQNVGAQQNIFRINRACRGVYWAMCEGDDYWIDPLKLQKQVDFMEAHPGVSYCFHNAFILNEKTGATRLFFETSPEEILDFDDACRINSPTASLMYRGNVFTTLPEWNTKIWCSDLLIRLWCAHLGNLGYLDEIMSVYRVHGSGMVASLGSWREQAHEQRRFMYNELDKETNGQYTSSIQAQIMKHEENYRRDRNPKVYYLLHPLKILARMREYYRAMKRHRSVRYFGNMD